MYSITEYYVTLYQTKHNQKEEAFNYHSVCLTLSRQIKKKQALLNEQSEAFVYFAKNMLATKKDTFKGKTVVISGSGNVAQYA